MGLSIVHRLWGFLLGAPAPHEEAPPDSEGPREEHQETAESRPLDASGTVMAEEFLDWVPEWAREDTDVGEEDGGAPDSKLDRSERHYLKAVVENPAQPSSAYHKLARMSTRKALGIRRRLVDLGYLREARVNLKKRGGAAIVLEPTARALELFESQRMNQKS